LALVETEFESRVTLSIKTLVRGIFTRTTPKKK